MTLVKVGVRSGGSRSDSLKVGGSNCDSLKVLSVGFGLDSLTDEGMRSCQYFEALLLPNWYRSVVVP